MTKKITDSENINQIYVHPSQNPELIQMELRLSEIGNLIIHLNKDEARRLSVAMARFK